MSILLTLVRCDLTFLDLEVRSTRFYLLSSTFKDLDRDEFKPTLYILQMDVVVVVDYRTSSKGHMWSNSKAPSTYGNTPEHLMTEKDAWCLPRYLLLGLCADLLI